MTNITSRLSKSLLAVVIAGAGVLGVATEASATTAYPAVPTRVASHLTPAGATCEDTSGFQDVDLSSLPTQATQTVDEIEAGGPFPYPEDGEVFQNREDILPDCALGSYHEYTVTTPGISNRGTRRIVTGPDNEYFYTGDHYASFELVDIND